MAAKRVDLTVGSVSGHLWRLWWPMVAGIAAMMSAQSVDAYFVAQLGTEELAGLVFATRFVFLGMALAIGLGAGAVSVVARAAARGSDEELQDLSAAVSLLAMVTSLFVSIVGILFVEPIFRALGAGDEIMPHIVDYMRVWFGGFAFMVVPMVTSSLLRGVGDTLWPSALMIGAAFLNVVLDPFMIHGFGPVPAMGVAGAAWATLLSRLVAFAGLLWLMVRVRGLLAMRAPSWPQMHATWSEVLRVGLPAVGTNMINPLGMIFATSIMMGAGVAAVAGFGVATQVEMFAIVPLFALSAAIGPITGQNCAADRYDRVARAFRTAYVMALLWAAAIALLFWLFGAEVIALFNREDDPGVPAYGLSFLQISPISTAGYGAVMVMAAGLNAMGRPWPGLTVTILRSLVLYAPGVWLGLTLYGPLGAAVGIAAANVLSGLAAWAYSEMRACPPQPAAARTVAP